MPKHVMLVGGGVGGTIVANLLSRHLSPAEAQVTLIESTGKHAYMPGWLPTNRATLEVKELEQVYALGDATDLPVSKSGSAAHIEAKVVAARILADIRSEAPKKGEALYDGEVMCFLETGYHKAANRSGVPTTMTRSPALRRVCNREPGANPSGLFKATIIPP